MADDNYPRIQMTAYLYGRAANRTQFRDNMTEMVKDYIAGKPIFVEFPNQPRRTGSVGRLYIDNMQDILHGSPDLPLRWGQTRPARAILPLDPALVKPEAFDQIRIQGHIKWDGRKNRIAFTGWDEVWVKGRPAELGTNWAYGKPPEPPKVQAKDKLGREINVGDFISYILYHFGGNNGNAAGIYYGKVTKIDNDGTVHAKNIKLQDGDISEEKRIKDNSLIVIMTKDLMDKLMMARLAVL